MYESQRGTVPGAPLADMLFQFCFGLFVNGLEQRLRETGEQVQRFSRDGGQSAYAPIPPWVDDLAVLVEAEQACDLPAKLRNIVVSRHGMMAAIGIQTNFEAGKTEAQIVLRGSGSLQIRREMLVHGNAELPIVLLDGRTVRLRLVETYVHLGTLTHAHACLMPELKRRAALAEGVFRKVWRAILHNRFVPLTDKVHCVEGMVVDKFMHNAGVWHFQTSAEQSKFHSTLMSFRRRMFWPACGFSPQFLSDVEACAALRVLLPEEILDIRRARQLCTSAHFGDAFLQSSVVEERTWLQEAALSLSRVAPQIIPQHGSSCEEDLSWILEICHQRRDALLNAIRRYKKQLLHGRAEMGQEVLRAASCRSHAEKLGVIFCRVPAWSDPALHGGVRCEVCGKCLKSDQACAVHRRQAHGIAAPSTEAARGTACVVCRKEFFSTSRLRAHLHRMPQCLRVHIEADMPPAQLHETVTGTSAWQPVTDFIGPSPFWATLRPVAQPLLIDDDGRVESTASCYRSFVGTESDVTSSLRAALRCAAELECQYGQSIEQTFRDLDGMCDGASHSQGCRLAHVMYDAWQRRGGCRVDVDTGCLVFDGSQHVIFFPQCITGASGFGRAFRMCEALSMSSRPMHVVFKRAFTEPQLHRKKKEPFQSLWRALQTALLPTAASPQTLNPNKP